METKIKNQIRNMLDTYKDLFGSVPVPSWEEYASLRKAAIEELGIYDNAEDRLPRSSSQKRTVSISNTPKTSQQNNEAMKKNAAITNDEAIDETVPITSDDPFRILQELGDPWN